MNSKLSVKLRPWTEADLYFTLKVRNHPHLMKWFRQDEPISVEEQREFIRQDTSPHGCYNGRIIEVDGVPVGLCGVKTGVDTLGEFTIAVLPEYQKKGISTEVMKQLVEMDYSIWSEVFVGNPALEFFISKCGFRISSVKERAYYKQGQGLVDVVKIYHA